MKTEGRFILYLISLLILLISMLYADYVIAGDGDVEIRREVNIAEAAVLTGVPVDGIGSIIDGNLNTQWEIPAGTYAPFVRLEFNRPRLVSSIEIHGSFSMIPWEINVVTNEEEYNWSVEPRGQEIIMQSYRFPEPKIVEEITIQSQGTTLSPAGIAEVYVMRPYMIFSPHVEGVFPVKQDDYIRVKKINTTIGLELRDAEPEEIDIMVTAEDVRFERSLFPADGYVGTTGTLYRIPVRIINDGAGVLWGGYRLEFRYGRQYPVTFYSINNQNTLVRTNTFTFEEPVLPDTEETVYVFMGIQGNNSRHQIIEHGVRLTIELWSNNGRFLDSYHDTIPGHAFD